MYLWKLLSIKNKFEKLYQLKIKLKFSFINKILLGRFDKSDLTRPVRQI